MRPMKSGTWLVAVAASLFAAGASAQAPPNAAQAAAAVGEFKRVHAECAAQGAACEAAAKRRFVEVMLCVVRGVPAADPATLDREFAAYVDLVAQALERPAGPAGEPGPCFAAGGAAPAATARPAAPTGPTPTGPKDQDGPTTETLRRFRKQAEEQSQPVQPTTVPDGVANEHDRLKGDIEAMRGRLQSGVPASGATLGAPAPAPAPVPGPPPTPTPFPGFAPPAPAAPTLPAPRPTGTTTIQGGPTMGTTSIQGGPASTPSTVVGPLGVQAPNRPGIKLPPPSPTPYKIPVPPGYQPPRRDIQLAPPSGTP